MKNWDTFIFRMSVFVIGGISRSGIAISYTSVFSLLRTLHTVSMVPAPMYIPSKSVLGFSLSLLCTLTRICYL